MDFSRFLRGPQLQFSQIAAMTSKKGLYSIRNYILLIIQFVIPSLFIIITMLSSSAFTGNQDLPSLAISIEAYLETVTTGQSSFAVGSNLESIFTSYGDQINALPSVHTFTSTNEFFEDHILDRYRDSVSDTNLNYMVGASFNDDNITAWFNNQGYHTAPLAINLINNAIWK